MENSVTPSIKKYLFLLHSHPVSCMYKHGKEHRKSIICANKYE